MQEGTEAEVYHPVREEAANSPAEEAARTRRRVAILTALIFNRNRPYGGLEVLLSNVTHSFDCGMLFRNFGSDTGHNPALMQLFVAWHIRNGFKHVDPSSLICSTYDLHAELQLIATIPNDLAMEIARTVVENDKYANQLSDIEFPRAIFTSSIEALKLQQRGVAEVVSKKIPTQEALQGDGDGTQRAGVEGAIPDENYSFDI